MLQNLDELCSLGYTFSYKGERMEETKLCKECGRVEHEPGMSEFSNCGESDISHGRDPEDKYDNYDG